MVFKFPVHILKSDIIRGMRITVKFTSVHLKGKGESCFGGFFGRISISIFTVTTNIVNFNRQKLSHRLFLRNDIGGQ